MQDEFQEVLNEIIKRIVSLVQPEKIVLFGSAARDEMGPHSDLDLLIIVGSTEHRRRMAQRIYRNLVGVGFAADIIVVTEDDISQFRNNIGTVIGQALEEGRVLYAA
jgi:uncharacterized protein